MIPVIPGVSDTQGFRHPGFQTPRVSDTHDPRNSRVQTGSDTPRQTVGVWQPKLWVSGNPAKLWVSGNPKHGDSPREALARAASSSPTVVTFAVNQPWQPSAAGRA